jgi:hypothetical protein
MGNHDSICVRWAIPDEGRPKAAAPTLVNVLLSPDAEGLDGEEGFAKTPYCQTDEMRYRSSIQRMCLLNIMVQGRLNLARTED